MDRCRQQLIKPILRTEGDAHLTPFRYQTKWDMDYGMEADTAWFTFGLVDYGLRYEMEPWRNPAERSRGNERRASGGVGNPKHGRFINRDPIGDGARQRGDGQSHGLARRAPTGHPKGRGRCKPAGSTSTKPSAGIR